MADRILRTIADVNEAFDRGYSPVVLVQNGLDRIDAANHVCNAMIFVDGDEALAEARIAEAEFADGRRKGPLHGVPMAVKDVIDVKGWPGGTLGTVSGGITRSQDEAAFRSVEHRASCSDLRLADCACRLYVQNNTVVCVDQVVRRIGKEGMAFVSASPLSSRIG